MYFVPARWNVFHNRDLNQHFWTYPQNKFLPKKFLILTPKKQFFKQKHFSRLFERKNHLARSSGSPRRNKFLPKKFLILTPRKTIFQTKKNFTPLERTDFLTKEKVSYNYLKIQFSKQKKFLYLPEKLISCTCTNENGSAIFYFSKLIRVQTENVIQSLFVKGLYFSTFYYTFLYSTSLCFSSSGRFLYHQRPLRPSNSYLDRFLKR